jgi:hypothetical protein
MLSVHQTFIGVFMVAVVFAFVASRTTNTILALLVIIIAAFAYVVRTQQQGDKGGVAGSRRLEADTEGRSEANVDNYYAALLEIAKDLRFVRIFDKPRYGDLLLMLDRFQKVYMYILGERYTCSSYVPTLMDLRDGVAEILYGLVFVVPEAFRHTYGFEPGPVIERNTARFTEVSRKMVDTVNRFCRDREPYFPMYAPRPYEHGREDRLP